MGAASEADSPRGAPNATNAAVSESAKPAVPKDTFQDEKVRCKQIHGYEEEKKLTMDGSQFGKGLVFYLRDKKIVGLLLFNVFGKVQEARDIINAGYTSDQIDGLLKK